MRTTISLPDPLLENAKLKAAERGITLSELVSEAVVCHLNARTDRPNATSTFRLITVPGKTLPGVDLNRTSEIIDAEDVDVYKSRMDR
jgi:hypothetical protein